MPARIWTTHFYLLVVIDMYEQEEWECWYTNKSKAIAAYWEEVNNPPKSGEADIYLWKVALPVHYNISKADVVNLLNDRMDKNIVAHADFYGGKLVKHTAPE